MKTIPSFTIDHIRLLRGIYVSRKDEVGGETVTTFDIRMKEPNQMCIRDRIYGDYMQLPDLENIHPHYNKLEFYK